MAGKSKSLTRAEATTSAIVSGDKQYGGYETDDYELIDGQVLPRLVPRHARPRSSPPVTIRFKKDLEEKILLPKNWRKLPTKQLKEFLRKQGMSGLSSDEEVEYFRLQGSSTGRSSLIQEDPAHQNGQTRRTPSPVEIEHFVKEMRIQGQMEERLEPQRSQLARIRLQNSLLSPELLRIEEERRRRLEEASGIQRQRLGSLQLQTEDAGTQIRNELRRRATSFQEVYSNSVNQDSGKSLQELYEEAVRNEKELKERLNQNGGRSFQELYEEAKKQKEEKEKVKRNRPGQ